MKNQMALVLLTLIMMKINKISEMEKVTDTVKYTIEFTLTKVNGEWQLDQLSNSDIEKLHGIYTS